MISTKKCSCLSFLFLFLIQGTLMAQGNKASNSSVKRMIPITLAYYGELELEDPVRSEPGLMIEFTVPLVSNIKSNPKHLRQLTLKPVIGFYNRKDYHTGVMLWTQVGFKTIRRSGFFWSVNAGPGYLHTFYNAPVYEQQDDGSFSQKKFVGEPNAILGGEIDLGWDFMKKREVPLSFFIGGGFWGEYPSNDQWTRHKFTKLGISYVIAKRN